MAQKWSTTFLLTVQNPLLNPRDPLTLHLSHYLPRRHWESPYDDGKPPNSPKLSRYSLHQPLNPSLPSILPKAPPNSMNFRSEISEKSMESSWQELSIDVSFGPFIGGRDLVNRLLTSQSRPEILSVAYFELN